MLQAWRRTQGEAKWEAWSRNVPVQGGSTGTPAQAPVAAAGPCSAHQVHRPRPATVADGEKKFIDEGYKNFHSAKALGGTIGISCAHVPSGWIEHPPQESTQVPEPDEEGGPASRHDQLVYSEPAQGQAPARRPRPSLGRGQHPTPRAPPSSPASTQPQAFYSWSFTQLQDGASVLAGGSGNDARSHQRRTRHRREASG